MFHLLILTATFGSVLPLPRQAIQNHEDSHNLKPLLFLIQRSSPQQQQQVQHKEERLAKQQQFGFSSPLSFGGFSYFEPQFRYPGINQHGFPRVQPSIVLYGAAGQGQPILINPGIPPGHNFLVPQQPRQGPNVGQRPQQRPFFVGGYPNPKPAHIPPIEKDAEEIPTDPASIPPLPSTPSVDRKPEKLETFNEDKIERPFKTTRTPQLQPGQRFFILNGDNLFLDYPFTYSEDLKYNRQQPQNLDEPRQPPPSPTDINSLPLQTFLSKNGQISSSNFPPEQHLFSPNLYPGQSGQQFDQNLATLRPELALFRSSLPLGDTVGHFRFTPPSEPYYPFDGEDVENEAVVVDAKYEDDIGKGVRYTENQDPSVSNGELDGSDEPSTAQAAPGAIALAGRGGVAGASPKATSLAGKGGLAVSSPQATAVAGADDEKVNQKNNRPAKKSRNK
ncbi:unnamed protein product [Phaedon cochleariae]|uniref:DUF4774 domain-containing protein n=1 Tax=Phaedon cochleariae TaxID=80249 RepID=A0A9P0DA12_PHACE|nr:unnamed protein product [Phaedon cochleariae]